MAEVLLFHHAMGQTPGFHALADQLREAGHTVHTPDLYGGLVFPTLPEGMAYAEEIGFGEIIARGERAAGELPEPAVSLPGLRALLRGLEPAVVRPGGDGVAHVARARVSATPRPVSSRMNSPAASNASAASGRNDQNSWNACASTG